jgi:peptidoglycan lytic transglycosylase F
VAAAPPLPAKDSAELVRGGVFRVVRIDAPEDDPFFTLSATHPGFDRELLEGFAHLHKLRFEVVTVPSWDDLVPALEQGKGDVIAGRFTVTAARRKRVDFTLEAFPTRHVVVTRKPGRTVLTAEELRKATVACTRGGAAEEAVLDAGVPKTSLVHVKFGSSWQALRDGRVTAVVAGVESAVVQARADPELELGMFLGPPRSLAYALRKDDVVLRRALDEYIEKSRRSGSWSRLVVKYFGEAGLAILKTVRQ